MTALSKQQEQAGGEVLGMADELHRSKERVGAGG